MKKFWAFTLAETLIVMGIIGVISALTLPNLNSSTGDKEKVAKVKKLYSNLNDAFGRATSIYGPVDEWGFNDGGYKTMERVMEFMKLSKSCGVTNPDACFKYSGNRNMPTYITADGTAILASIDSNCRKLNTTDVLTYCGTILIDIDGSNKGKNIGGNDIFDFFYTSEQGLIPRGMERADYNSATNCLNWLTECAGWVIDYDNMDYLKAQNSSHKCPNGTVLSATVTSCK